jgi:Tat protein secretion system quality control protein TatD with DNase activity
VARMETKEILLETDAPFLPPYDAGPSSLYIHSHFCTLGRTCNGWYGQSQSRQQLHISTLPEGYQVGLIDLQSIAAPNCSATLIYGVCNYVFPRSWNRWREHIEGSKQLLVTFVIHPHVAAHGVTRPQLDQLGSLLVESKCVAVGEIGILGNT